MAKPTRTFDGSVGQRSTGTAGPEALKTDIGNAMAMFDPDKNLADGSQGGLAIENFREVPALKSDFDAHVALASDVHGAVSTATASKIVIRDVAGRARFASPADSEDAATKGYVDAHSSLSAAHGATSAATPNAMMIRDAAGRAKVAAPVEADDIARKADVDAAGGSYAPLAAFNAHVAATSVHGAVSTPTASTLVIRDGSGRARVIAPSDPDDIAIKQTVDDHAALTAAHSATSAATASRLVIRDAAGRAKVAAPAASDDIAVKATVDAVQANLTAHTSAASPHSGHATTSDLNSHTGSTSAHSATSAATASRIVLRDAAGRAKVAAPSAEDDIALKSNVTTVQTNLTNHANLTAGVHGAVSTNTASKLVIRDASARAQFADPSAAQDAATKNYVDAHATLTNPHSSTSAATANRLVLRDASGRAQFASPSASSDAATKGYVDAHIDATTGVHGAVSTATANKIAIRDASGRMAVVDGSAAGDCATKGQLDAHAATTNAHSAVSTATASRIVLRDASGRAAFADPAAAGDAATKGYVDGKFDPTTGHKHTGAAGDAPKIPMTSLADTAAGNVPVARESASVDHDNTFYVRAVEFTVGFGGAVRVKYKLRALSLDPPITAYARVYINDVATGTEHSTTSYTGVEFSDDVSVAAGDRVQVWIKSSQASYNADLSDTRLCVAGSVPTVSVSYVKPTS